MAFCNVCSGFLRRTLQRWRLTLFICLCVYSLYFAIEEFIYLGRTSVKEVGNRNVMNSEAQIEGCSNKDACGKPIQQVNNWSILGINITSRDLMNETNGLGDAFREKFYSGEWVSSTRSYEHHFHFKVNCSGIIKGDQSALYEANQILFYAGKAGQTQIPSDEVVTTWTRNCDYYKWKRKYPTDPRSVEEAEYPLGYILTVHKDSAQVERLLRSIYHPQNLYCIHVDMNAAEDFWTAMRGMARCFDNIFIASKLEHIQYRGFSRLQADINCMNDLMYREDHQWNYVINLCGQDFPLKTNLEIVQQLKAYEGHNDIPGVYPKQNAFFIERTRNHHRIIDGEVKVSNISKPPPPHGAKMHFGNAYYVASRPFVDYILKSKTANDILYYLEDSNSPDEHYWVTMNRFPGAPGGYPYSTWDSSTRFIRWTVSNEHPPCVGKYVRQVCIIGSGYLPYVTSIPHLFANKFHYEFDPIALQCIEEMLDYRTVMADTIHEFVPVYPLTDLFPDNPSTEKLPFQ